MNSALLRARIEAHVPAAFRFHTREAPEVIATGISELDSLISGIPVRALTEICGSQSASSGKSSLMLSLLANATQGNFCALVDPTDSLHPESASVAGVNFSRLAWIRCDATRSHLRTLRAAFKTTDMLLKAGGFRLIVTDLSGIEKRLVRKVPLSFWFSFSRAVETMRTALVFLQSVPCANSSAGLVLNVTARSNASVSTGPSHTKLFRELQISAEVIRARSTVCGKKPVQSTSSTFTANTQWS